MERESQKMKIAVILTCHNRKDSTLECLRCIADLRKPGNIEVEIFLVNDGSTDGTEEAVRRQFPLVYIIPGHGELYWNGGMRLAWEVAAEQNNYDFYFWVNDDTNLEQDALEEMLFCEREARKISPAGVVIVGACCDKCERGRFSYGGRIHEELIVPDGSLQECIHMNGNCVLIPRIVYEAVGNLSPDFTHTCGDYDYGLRAIENGFKLFTTRKYVAKCSSNKWVPVCFNGDYSIRVRFREFNKGKKFNKVEYRTYLTRHLSNKWILLYAKAYIKMLFPQLYHRFKCLQANGRHSLPLKIGS